MNETPKLAGGIKTQAPGDNPGEARKTSVPAALAAVGAKADDVDRAVAERLVSLPLSLWVVCPGQPPVDAKKGLPAERFQIEKLYIDERVSVTDADCELISKLDGLKYLVIDSSPTDAGLARLCRLKNLCGWVSFGRA